MNNYRQFNPEGSFPDSAKREAARRVEKPFGRDEYAVGSDPFRDWRLAVNARGERMMYHKDQFTYLGPFPTRARAEKSKKRAHAILMKLGAVGMLRGTHGLQVIQHRRAGSVRPPGWYVEVESY